MGDHHHTTIVYPIMPPPANAIHIFQISGSEAQCGCPVMFGCGSCGNASIGPVYVLPLEAQGIITMEEMHELVRDFDAILRRTHWPMLPLMFTHFCIPFSPIRILAVCASRRESQLRDEIAKVNTKLMPRGAHLEMAPPIALRSGQAFMYLIRHPTPGQDPAMMSMYGGQVPMATAAVLPNGYRGVPGGPPGHAVVPSGLTSAGGYGSPPVGGYGGNIGGPQMGGLYGGYNKEVVMSYGSASGGGGGGY